FLAFFAYVERGAPWRRAYTLFTIAGAVALSLVSFPGLTGTAGFFFDSFTLTGFARVSYYLGLTNASLLYSLAPLALGALALAIRRIPLVLATVAIAVAVATGIGVYATDRLATDFAARTFNAEPADWLDRAGLGPATYLVLPEADYFVGTGLESWNRDVRHVAVLHTEPPDSFPSTVARVTRDGSLELGNPAGIVVANVAGSAIGLDGTVVARPRTDLVAYRLPAHPHVRWLADGLAPDRWTGAKLRYQAWPVRAGRYELTLSLPRGEQPRRVWIGKRTFVVSTTRHVSVPTDCRPLVLQVKVPNAPLGARALGVQVPGLPFVPR